MHSQAAALSHKSSATKPKRALSQRVPRMGKVVFAENGNPVHCAVKNLSQTNATLTMTGWLGLPSSFILFVEPDSIRAQCRVLQRKGSNVDVEFTDVEEGVRYRSVA